MSILSSFVRTAAPVVAAVAPVFGPVGTAVGFAASGIERDTQKSKAKEARLVREQQEREVMSEIFGSGQNYSSIQAPRAGMSTTQAGFGSSFGTFLGDVGRNIVSPFANLFSAAAPLFGRSSAQQPAVTTIGGRGAQESQGSGTIDAFSGLTSFAPALQAAGRFIRSPAGSLATGTGAGLLTGLLDGQGPKMRITRKMKSQYRSVLNLAGGDYALAAQMIGVSQDMFIAVLLKRFRNDGPVVTKAALRKTKTTVRRLKNMCDMYDSLRPTATRRRTPMKRASTTLISNK
jgi:hypothetical protein